jgi:hypothetical protein
MLSSRGVRRFAGNENEPLARLRVLPAVALPSCSPPRSSPAFSSWGSGPTGSGSSTSRPRKWSARCSSLRSGHQRLRIRSHSRLPPLLLRHRPDGGGGEWWTSRRDRRGRGQALFAPRGECGCTGRRPTPRVRSLHHRRGGGHGGWTAFSRRPSTWCGTISNPTGSSTASRFPEIEVLGLPPLLRPAPTEDALRAVAEHLRPGHRDPPDSRQDRSRSRGRPGMARRGSARSRSKPRREFSTASTGVRIRS